jgi:VIT1/CCC1 family predicted Fe2+/Mn2+ transporter
MYGSYSKVSRDPESDELWRRAGALEQRLARARVALDQTAIRRLRHARRVLVEERANLDAYLVELGDKLGRTTSLVADVMAASSRDVVEEIDALVIRSEVGLLDVAWSKKAVEEEEARKLETQRDRDVRDIEGAVKMGLEDLQP